MKSQLIEKNQALASQLDDFRKNNFMFVSRIHMWNHQHWIAPHEFEPQHEKSIPYLASARDAQRGTAQEYKQKHDAFLGAIEDQSRLTPELIKKLNTILNYFSEQLTYEITVLESEFDENERYSLGIPIQEVKTLGDKQQFFRTLERNEYSVRLDINSAYNISRAMLDCLEKALQLLSEEQHKGEKDYFEQNLLLIEKAITALESTAQKYIELRAQIQKDLPGVKQDLYQKVDQEFTELLAPLIAKTETLAIKAEKNERYVDASLKANQLVDDLEQARTNFVKGSTSVTVFEQQCKDALKDAKHVLSQHRGWGPLLAKIKFWLSSLLTLGVAPAASRCITGQWNFFAAPKTESEQVREQVSDQIQVLFN